MKFKELIKKNYSHKVTQQTIDNEIKYGISDGDDFLALDNSVYQERIYFDLGPKEVILSYSNKSNAVLRFENRVLNGQSTENRSGAVFVANDSGKNRIVSIF